MRRKTGQPGPERERAGGTRTLLLSHSYLQQGTGGPGQAAAGQVARQGRAPVVPVLRLCGLQQISLALDTGTATGHSDSSSGTGLVSLRSARLLLARKIANKKSSLLAVAGFS